MARPDKLDRIPALLDALVTTPAISAAARRVGLSGDTVFRYLVRSRMGDDKLQAITWHGVTAPFHVHATQNARALSAQAIEAAALDRALNGCEVDVFWQGQRQYERVKKSEYAGYSDDELKARGHNVEECYETRPVKQWLKPSDALVLKMLESWNKRYRPHQQIDVTYGGVLRLERPEERRIKTIEAKPIFDDPDEARQHGGHLALARPAKDSAELDKWNAAGEFAPQPVRFVDAEGNRTELVATPDPLLAQSDERGRVHDPKAVPDPKAAAPPQAAVTPDQGAQGNCAVTSPQQRRATPPQQSAGDGRERVGRGVPAKGGYRIV